MTGTRGLNLELFDDNISELYARYFDFDEVSLPDELDSDEEEFTASTGNMHSGCCGGPPPTLMPTVPRGFSRRHLPINIDIPNSFVLAPQACRFEIGGSRAAFSSSSALHSDCCTVQP